ncbi:unnamed protein product, partial [Choristocarpus tenellus]
MQVLWPRVLSMCLLWRSIFPGCYSRTLSSLTDQNIKRLHDLLPFLAQIDGVNLDHHSLLTRLVTPTRPDPGISIVHPVEGSVLHGPSTGLVVEITTENALG